MTTTFELPGLTRDDVHIGVHNNVLTVSGEAKPDTELDDKGYAIRERKRDKFERSVLLPHGTQVVYYRDAIDSVLTLVL